VRADDDQIGFLLLRQAQELVGRVAARLHEVRLEPALLQQEARPLEHQVRRPEPGGLRGLAGWRDGDGGWNPSHRCDRHHQRLDRLGDELDSAFAGPDADDDEPRCEDPRELTGPFERPSGRLAVVVARDDRPNRFLGLGHARDLPARGAMNRSWPPANVGSPLPVPPAERRRELASSGRRM
jgi:hypothetical protein